VTDSRMTAERLANLRSPNAPLTKYGIPHQLLAALRAEREYAERLEAEVVAERIYRNNEVNRLRGELLRAQYDPAYIRVPRSVLEESSVNRRGTEYSLGICNFAYDLLREFGGAE
jgi:hypothetical protein